MRVVFTLTNVTFYSFVLSEPCVQFTGDQTGNVTFKALDIDKFETERVID